ncbi:MAG: DUF1573 domain-containing protein [Tannerella sp.]|jgi:hypothetical protein|nr:DUF1573 domain-containing protein [Tannerella sp.]
MSEILYKYIFTCVLPVFMFVSCQKQTAPCILTEQSFKEMVLKSENEQKYFCILLIDTFLYKTTNLLSNRLNDDEFKYLREKAVFNMVNIYAEENRWYEKWLCPVSVPLTCVFSPDGTLLDLIPGLTYESIAYMNKAVKENRANDEYYCYNRFQLNKRELVFAMNEVLQAKRKSDRGENAKPLIDSAVARVKYPYSLFIKLKNEDKQRDTVNMRNTFTELLSINDAYSLFHYTEEFAAAKKMMDSAYDVSEEPFLEVLPVIVEIGNCKYRERKEFHITLKNKGKRAINISDVETSCSCVTNSGDKKYKIAAFDSICLSFGFTAEQKGEIERYCYFVSDARNAVVDVKITATVE